MVAKISVGNSLYGAIAYNGEKINEAQGRLLTTNRIYNDGTGTYKTIAAFLDSQGPGLPYLCSVRVTSSDHAADLPTALLPRLHRDIHSRIPFPVCVPTVLFICGTGISTCYPSTTSFDLALGPDLPRADQLYSGNLRYSAWRIPTSISLLIPAFSLLKCPQLLTGTASSL